ncbi:MAG: DUF6754 domain-containing protein [Candidatus Cloacimonadales bacterium]
MKLNLGKLSSLALLTVFCFLLIPLNSNADVGDSDYIVQNLRLEDIPNDDGGGLVFSWEPLPQEKRIIEYRVYRGVTPDSLFYIGKVDVNPQTGVTGDEVFFYDADYNAFLGLENPAKLKKEDQQADDSPLYKPFPRDVAVSGPQLKNFDILGIINEDDFYYKNKKVEVENEDGETEVYAGLKLRHFSGLYKKLIPGKEYYYTVLAVTEQRKYMPHAEPVVGSSIVNSPEKTTGFYSVYVPDAERLQFEWTRATFDADHASHNIYLIEDNDLADFETYVEEQIKMEADPEFTPTITDNPAQLIFSRYSGYPYTPDNTAIVETNDGQITIAGETVDIDTNNIDNYRFAFSIQDRNGFETFSDLAASSLTYQADLPRLPTEWNVLDRKDDKGDYNVIYWGKPVAYLTNSSYLNEDKTKLLVNYDIFTNIKYDIDKIYFTLYSGDQEIDTINEFYQDKKLVFRLDEPALELEMKINIRTKQEDDENYVFTQRLVYDDNTKSLVPDVLLYNDEKVNNYSYSIYKNNYSNEEWRLSKTQLGAQRELRDNISYSMPHFKGVSKFDAEKQMFLVDPSFSIRMTDERDATISSKLYQSEVEASVEQYQKEIDKYSEMQAEAETDAEKASYQGALDYYQAQINLLENNEILQRATEFKSDEARVRFLKKVKHVGNRSFKYKIVRSDGKANFSVSEVFSSTDENRPLPYSKNITKYYPELGTKFFYPIPNWFSSDKLITLFATLIFGILVFFMIFQAKHGRDLYVRPIAGIEEIDNAIGRATEMGKPILFVPGLSGISDVATLAGLSILGRVAKKAAEYDTKILVPVRDYIVLPIAQEIVKEAHYEAGRPDTHDKNSVFFITTAQFAFVAGVNGVMLREKTATNFYMGMFWAEALIMTENGSATGAIQISGTDAVTQIPFFITTCDYTLIGEELYAASAYLAREPLQLGTLKAVDYTKFLILVFIIVGSILSTVQATFLINAFPEK